MEKYGTDAEFEAAKVAGFPWHHGFTYRDWTYTHEDMYQIFKARMQKELRCVEVFTPSGTQGVRLVDSAK